MYIQHSLSYAVHNFHLNWLTFLEAMMDVLGVHFLSRHSVVTLSNLPPTAEAVSAVACDVCLSVC